MHPVFFVGLILAVLIFIVFYFRGEMMYSDVNVIGTTRKLQFEDVFNTINESGDRLYAWGGDEASYGKPINFNIGTASDADSNKILSTEWSKTYSKNAGNLAPLAFRNSFSQPYSMNKSPITQVSKPMTINDIVSMPASVTKPTTVQTVVSDRLYARGGDEASYGKPLNFNIGTAVDKITSTEWTKPYSKNDDTLMPASVISAPEMMDTRIFGLPENMMTGRRYGPEMMMTGRKYGPEMRSRYND